MLSSTHKLFDYLVETKNAWFSCTSFNDLVFYLLVGFAPVWPPAYKYRRILFGMVEPELSAEPEPLIKEPELIAEPNAKPEPIAIAQPEPDPDPLIAIAEPELIAIAKPVPEPLAEPEP